MKPPEIIYLQWNGDGESTWCIDQIEDNDVVYVLQSALTTAQEEITASRNFIEDILGHATKAQLRAIEPFLVKYKSSLNGGQ